MGFTLILPHCAPRNPSAFLSQRGSLTLQVWLILAPTASNTRVNTMSVPI